MELPQSEVDLTPKFWILFVTHLILPCTGYGICAPLGLCWSCNDQVMKPNGTGCCWSDKLTVFAFSRMVLEPSLGGTKTTFKYEFWLTTGIVTHSFPSPLGHSLHHSPSCWPPTSSGLFCCLPPDPNKFDDPKDPSIHVPQVE